MKMQHYIIHSKGIMDEKHHQISMDAYKVFKAVWESTLQEIHGPEFKLFSNDFTRQDRIHALFMGSECMGLTCLRKVNLENPIDREDSWLQIWTQDHYNSLHLTDKSNVYINSFFTLSPPFRKSQLLDSVPIGYLLGCLSLLDQLDLSIPLVLGMMRRDRSMHKLGSLWGSELLEGSVIYNNTPTDLVVFREDNVKKASLDYPSLVFDIWNQRIDFTKGEKSEKYQRVA